MQNLQSEVQALRCQAAEGADLDTLVRGVCGALSRHPEELQHITASYRFQATDTGMTYSFALEQGVYSDLDPTVPVTVCVSGTQDQLMGVIRGQINPLKALLLGRIKIQGKKEALFALGAFL